MTLNCCIYKEKAKITKYFYQESVLFMSYDSIPYKDYNQENKSII